MIKKGSRVTHKNSEINKERGIMSVLEIKKGYAICGYLDFAKLHLGPWVYKLDEIQLA